MLTMVPTKIAKGCFWCGMLTNPEVQFQTIAIMSTIAQIVSARYLDVQKH